MEDEKYRLTHSAEEIDEAIDAIAPINSKISGIAETGTNYIELSNGVRVYFSDTEPTGTIPEGSIGIGF